MSPRTSVLTLLLLALPASARAESEKVVALDLAQVFPSSVRFLRLYEHVDLVEKDADAGYVLFDLKEENKKFRGALELVPFEGNDGRQSVRMILRIEDRPEYVENGMLERLERKLRKDHGGTPRKDPPKKAAPKKEPAPDAPIAPPAAPIVKP